MNKLLTPTLNSDIKIPVVLKFYNLSNLYSTQNVNTGDIVYVNPPAARPDYIFDGWFTRSR